MDILMDMHMNTRMSIPAEGTAMSTAQKKNVQ